MSTKQDIRIKFVTFRLQNPILFDQGSLLAFETEKMTPQPFEIASARMPLADEHSSPIEANYELISR